VLTWHLKIKVGGGWGWGGGGDSTMKLFEGKIQAIPTGKSVLKFGIVFIT